MRRLLSEKTRMRLKNARISSANAFVALICFVVFGVIPLDMLISSQNAGNWEQAYIWLGVCFVCVPLCILFLLVVSVNWGYWYE